MTDLQTAKNNLAEHTICLCKDGECLYSDKRGIAPMMDYIAQSIDLCGYSVADKVVGKAAALLFVKCGIVAVYAQNLSLSGKEIFDRHSIIVEYNTLAEKIINRAGTDICPMEKAVLNCFDAEEAYILLKNKIRNMQTII